MKFYSGKGVLEYWYNYGYAVKNYSTPGIFISEEDEIAQQQIRPEDCDYPDWWYTWIDIDKIIMKLSRKEHLIIIYYFTKVYDITGEYEKWSKKDEFTALCDKVYRFLDAEEYKPVRDYRYSAFERTLFIIRQRIERGIILTDGIDKDKMYTVEEVANILRFTDETIRKALLSGELYGFKLNHQWRIPGSSLLKLIGGVTDE